MQRWCLNCKVFGDEESFFPNAPERALCKTCIKNRVRSRNKAIFEQAKNLQREQEAIRGIVKQFQQNGEPFIYLIEHENKYKIGYSRNIDKRLKNFNTSHALPCKIIAVVPGDNKLEQQLHKSLSLHRISGEWFLKKQKVIKEFEKLQGVMIFLPGYLRSESNSPSDVSDVSEK